MTKTFSQSLLDLTALVELQPSIVTIPVARKLLGDKSRTEVYEAIARGDLVALKDGNKTVITVASINTYIAALPRAKIKPPNSDLDGD